MAKLKVKVTDPIGLHARPAAFIINAAAEFVSDVTIRADGKEANAKSIINVMALAVKTNTDIEIEAVGEDADEAIEKIKKVMLDQKLISI